MKRQTWAEIKMQMKPGTRTRTEAEASRLSDELHPFVLEGLDLPLIDEHYTRGTWRGEGKCKEGLRRCRRDAFPRTHPSLQVVELPHLCR